jgi:energy-coupling factor transporter ATP-binding protein EcfA2
MIRIEKLSFVYKDKHYIHYNRDLNLEKGSVLLITGKSGSGKTTLCEILAKQHKITSGKIFFQDKDIEIIKDNDYFSKIHFLKQNPHHNFIGLNPSRDFLLWNQKEKLAPFFECLEKYQLLDKKEDLLWKMSFGEQKCLFFIYLELIKRDLWVLDEPLEGVDPRRRELFLETCHQHISTGGSALITSHRTDHYQSLSPKVISFE